MTDIPDRVPTPCPSCSPDLETVHEVLTTTEGGGTVTVRCSECGHVHKVQPERTREVTLDVVVSQEGESFTANVTVPEEDPRGRRRVYPRDRRSALDRPRHQPRVGPTAPHRRPTPTGSRRSGVAKSTTSRSTSPSTHRTARDDSRSITVHVPGDYEFEVGAVELRRRRVRDRCRRRPRRRLGLPPRPLRDGGRYGPREGHESRLRLRRDEQRVVSLVVVTVSILVTILTATTRPRRCRRPPDTLRRRRAPTAFCRRG